MKIKGVEYRFEKLSARKQFHVMRRLAPAIADFAPLFKLVGKDVKSLSEQDQQDIGIQAVEAFGTGLSKLKDEDADFILDSLLDTASYQLDQGLGWAPVRSNGVLMRQDFDMPTELGIAFGAIKENFTDFIPAIRSILNPSK